MKEQLFGHPRGLFYLFFAELWERFSFYGMRALLTLYMVKEIFQHAPERDTFAVIVFASYGSLIYATPLIGGYLSDKLLGLRRSIILGGALMAIGHFIMAIENEVTFFLALGFLVIGNGFFKPNVSAFVGALYEKGDPRKDSGYNIYYMGINIGGALAPLACGYLGFQYGWNYGFGLAGVGMLIGLFCFLRGVRVGVFKDRGLPPASGSPTKRVFGFSLTECVTVLAVLAAPFLGLMIFSHGYIAQGTSFLGETTIVELLFKVLGGCLVVYMAYLLLIKVTAKERQQLLAVLFLTFCMTIFWGVFELQGSTLTLFADRNINLIWFNASQTNAMNPLFIILLAVPMSFLWRFLAKRNCNPRSPYKFSFGLIWSAIAFYTLAISHHWVDASGKVSFYFLLVAYFFISTGELFMSPVGLSKVTELSPKRMIAFIMGIWYLSSAYAFQIVGFIGQALAVKDDSTQDIGTNSLIMYTDGFMQIGHLALGTGLVAMLLSPIIKRLMHEVH